MLNPVHKLKPTAWVSRSLMVLVGGQLVAALAGLVYGKLTAIYISPAVWGDYNLLFIATTLLNGLFVTPTLQSFKATLLQFAERQVITFYTQMLLLIYCTLFLLVALVAGLYCQNPIFGLIWIAIIGQGAYQFGSNYLNAAGQHRRYALMQAGYAVGAVIAFALVVICFTQRSVSGLWQTLVIVNSLFALLSVWWLKISAFGTNILTNSTELFRTYRHYVRPLLSLAFWGWLINYTDRYLIRLYLTDADVGQYAMGYGLGSKLLLLVAPLLAFLSPEVLRLRATGQLPETANLLIRRYLIRYVLLAGMGCLVFYLGREWIGKLLLSDRYAPAFLVGPVVAIGYLFLTSIHVLELKWYAFGQTRFVLWHNVLGAILNIVFNLLLIPRMGIVGAALATLLGFIGQFLLAVWLFTATKLNNP